MGDTDIITGASCNSGKMLAASAFIQCGPSSLTSLQYANVCVWLHATSQYSRTIRCGIYYCTWFYHVIPNLVVRNEPNLDWFQGKYRRSDAENIGSVCLMVREKIGLQTDRHGDNISVFFPMRKKALKRLVVLNLPEIYTHQWNTQSLLNRMFIFFPYS